MPKKSKTLLDHANDLATDLADKIGPQVESAVGSARDKAGPVLADARDKARDVTAPAVHDAREKINADVLPAIAAALAAANEATEDVRGETKKRGKAAVAALRGEVEAPKKKHRLRNFLVLVGLGGLAAVVAKKLSDRPSSTTWESNYTPSPAPAAPAGADTSGAHRAADAHDQGGSSPDVAAADAAAEPHEATTPDDPAETIDVKRD